MFLHHAASKLAGGQRHPRTSGYLLRADDLRLSKPDERLRALLKDIDLRGIYLWTVRPGPSDDDEHAVYIGRTQSLGRRMAEYLRGFQPHAVNDFKLKVFQEQLLSRHERARFALYFKQIHEAPLPAAEKEAIAEFKPLLNNRLQVPDVVRARFQAAFEVYYHAGFKPFLPPAELTTPADEDHQP